MACLNAGSESSLLASELISAFPAPFPTPTHSRAAMLHDRGRLAASRSDLGVELFSRGHRSECQKVWEFVVFDSQTPPDWGTVSLQANGPTEP